jgi:hypothetical protein
MCDARPSQQEQAMPVGDLRDEGWRHSDTFLGQSPPGIARTLGGNDDRPFK